MVPTSIRSHTILCVSSKPKNPHTHFSSFIASCSFFFCDFRRALSPSHATGSSPPAILGSDTQSVAISSSLPAAEWTQRGVATKWNGHLWPALLQLLFAAPELEHGSFVLGARGHVAVHPPSFARPQRAWVPPFPPIAVEVAATPAQTPTSRRPRGPRGEGEKSTMTYDKAWGRVHRTRDQRADCTTRAPTLVACRGWDCVIGHSPRAVTPVLSIDDGCSSLTYKFVGQMTRLKGSLHGGGRRIKTAHRA